MAAAAASAAAISSLSLRRRHLPSLPSIFSVSFNFTPPKTLSLFRARPTSVSTLLSSKIKASDDDDDDFETSFSDDADASFSDDDDDVVDTSLSEDDDDDVDASLSDDVDTSLSDDVDTTVSDELETPFSDEVDPDSAIVFDPSEDYDPTDDLDEIPTESEKEIAAAYEELYGPAFSGISVLGNDIYAEDANRKDEIAPVPVTTEGRTSDGFEERVVQVRRVTKVVKGGKQLQFRAIVIIGDKQGHVGVGVAKGREVTIAVEKSARDARRNIIIVPMTKYLTFPHRSEGRSGAAKVMLRPAAPGTGVIAGGSVRVVLELAGVENALGKQLGSGNALNNARATIDAILQMRQFSEVALERGIPMEELWK